MTMSTDQNFCRERRAETVSNRGLSAYQPNALPLGQTGSLAEALIPAAFSLTRDGGGGGGGGKQGLE